MNYRPFAIMAGAGIVLLIVSNFPIARPLFDLDNAAIQPVLASETTAARKSINLFTVIASIKDLARDNAQLQSKNNELQSQLSQLKEVQHENDILRQELNFTQETKDTYLPAQLIGRTPSGVTKDILINRGSNDQLVVGQAVMAQGYLIGTVSQVHQRQSSVQLLTHPQSIVPVLAQDSRATGLLRGGISGLSLTDLLIDAPVKSNEPVVTSGLGGSLPAGIPIGKVVSVSSRQGDITKKATVSSPVDVTKLEVVFIRKVSK